MPDSPISFIEINKDSLKMTNANENVIVFGSSKQPVLQRQKGEDDYNCRMICNIYRLCSFFCILSDKLIINDVEIGISNQRCLERGLDKCNKNQYSVIKIKETQFLNIQSNLCLSAIAVPLLLLPDSNHLEVFLMIQFHPSLLDGIVKYEYNKADKCAVLTEEVIIDIECLLRVNKFINNYEGQYINRNCFKRGTQQSLDDKKVISKKSKDFSDLENNFLYDNTNSTYYYTNLFQLATRFYSASNNVFVNKNLINAYKYKG